MKTRKLLRKLLLAIVVLIAAVIVVGLGFWLIDGRSPQAFIVSHSLKKSTMETYAMRKAEKTDKSTIEIPDGVTFPREVTQYRVGHMQVFESPAQDDSKPVLLYIHGGAYYQNFNMLHWKAMAEWAETTGCGIVAPNYPMLYQYTAKDAHPLMMQLYRQLLERFPARRIIIAGDSAGGGFTLALTQEMKADSIDLPSHLILISPWVDVTGGDNRHPRSDGLAALRRHAGTTVNRTLYWHVGSVLYGYPEDLRQDEGRRRGCPLACEEKDGTRLSALAVPGGKGSPRGDR